MPVLHCHGSADGVVRLDWAEAGAERLRQLAVPLEMRRLAGFCLGLGRWSHGRWNDGTLNMGREKGGVPFGAPSRLRLP